MPKFNALASNNLGGGSKQWYINLDFSNYTWKLHGHVFINHIAKYYLKKKKELEDLKTIPEFCLTMSELD